jgi:hypothetical protein
VKNVEKRGVNTDVKKGVRRRGSSRAPRYLTPFFTPLFTGHFTLLFTPSHRE